MKSGNLRTISKWLFVIQDFKNNKKKSFLNALVWILGFLNIVTAQVFCLLQDLGSRYFRKNTVLFASFIWGS